jgi:hypothetical protein
MRLGNRYLAEPLEPRLLLSFDMPAVFVPNQGQWDPAIRYAAHGTGADILAATGPLKWPCLGRPRTSSWR